jgi:hypothetical protein
LEDCKFSSDRVNSFNSIYSVSTKLSQAY